MGMRVPNHSVARAVEAFAEAEFGDPPADGARREPPGLEDDDLPVAGEPRLVHRPRGTRVVFPEPGGASNTTEGESRRAATIRGS